MWVIAVVPLFFPTSENWPLCLSNFIHDFFCFLLPHRPYECTCDLSVYETVAHDEDVDQRLAKGTAVLHLPHRLDVENWFHIFFGHISGL